MEYKGIYYGESKPQKFFEGGAHFKYSDLYKRLELLEREIHNNENIRNNNNENYYYNRFGKYYIEEKPIKNIIHTRNINKNYFNNPNTQITNFNRTISDIDKFRKKSENKNLNININPNIETYQKINKINNISSIPINKDYLRHNSYASNNSNNNVSRNKSSNVMNYQKSTDSLNYTNNLILSLRMQIANNIKNKHQIPHHKNISLENNKSPEYYIKYYNLIDSKSRNKNSMNYLRTSEKKNNVLTVTNGNNNNSNYQILFHRTMNHNQRIYQNNFIINHNSNNVNYNNYFNNLNYNKNIYNDNKNINYMKKRLNDNSSEKYLYKNLIYNKLNLNGFKSGENIFNKHNLVYYKN